MRKLMNYPGIEVMGTSRQSRPGIVQVSSYADAPGGDVLVHLAEVSDRSLANSKGLAYQQACRATVEILLRKKYERVVYASSAVLYGDQNDNLCKIDDPIHVVDTYTRVKCESEQMLREKKGVIARIVNLYGPGMASGNVMSTILNQVLLDGPIHVLDVNPIRDFLWIEDAASALEVMSLGSATGVFNVGTGQGTSVLQLATSVINASRQFNRAIESKTQVNKRSHLVVDISETINHFGWRPTTSLERGIQVLVDLLNVRNQGE
jgi:UDP-glucose 4-epimerase